jgi:hypothetical protein
MLGNGEKMKKQCCGGKALIVLSLVGLAAAGGCGTLSSLSKLGSSNSKVASTFGGHWAGPWTDSAGHQGTLDVVVGTDGKLTGSVVDTTASKTGSVTGATTNNGGLTATEAYPAGPTVTVTGTVSIGANGHMAGAMQTSVPGQPNGSGSFDLVKQ